MKLLWVTDIHLDHVYYTDTGELTVTPIQEFCAAVNSHKPDAVVITGDISTGRLVTCHLRMLDEGIHAPIYYLHGNHDFFHSSFDEIEREHQWDIAGSLKWLQAADPIKLTANTTLIGADGWYDGGGLGDAGKIMENLNDVDLIKDFRNKSPTERRFICSSRANKAARLINEAFDKVTTPNVIIATHVPPFAENALYRGEVTNLTPCYVSKQMGDTLMNLARLHPERNFQVLCGHSHSKLFHQPLPNLTCQTGPSRYGNPEQSILVISVP